MLDCQKKSLNEFLQLDKGQLVRLVNMRLRRMAQECQCTCCSDLLSRLHHNDAMLTHTHVIEQWGLKHWLDLLSTYPDPRNPETCAFADYRMNDVLYDHEQCFNLLLETERAWKASLQAHRHEADSDEVWLKRFHKLKLACEAFRKHAETKLEREQPDDKLNGTLTTSRTEEESE